MSCGGLSEPKAATAETQQITREERCQAACCGENRRRKEYLIKSQLEEKESRNFDTFDAVSYKTQVVAGINYFIKIHVGNDEYFHVRVYKRLPHENKPMELTNYQSKKEKHDDLTYF
ncbi:cystatin-B-like isoform X1 [Pituophis catenifer annectens]|uniref:cystatin-B-like isoform X1 n=1 Tax=Pituophis catenifer annectens TaxID=94852 RepID=UPI003996A420